MTSFRRLLGPAVAALHYPGIRRASRRSFAKVDRPSTPAPPLQRFEGVQLPSSGVGPGLHRRYRVDVAGTAMTPSALIAAFVADPNRFAPIEYATFGEIADPSEPAALEVGGDVMVRISGPFDAPVRVMKVAEDEVVLQTREGHLEAGQIRLAATREGSALRFEITSWSRSAGMDIHLLWWSGLAYELQTVTWTHVCRRAASVSGGRAGTVLVRTEALRGEDWSLLGEAADMTAQT